MMSMSARWGMCVRASVWVVIGYLSYWLVPVWAAENVSLPCLVWAESLDCVCAQGLVWVDCSDGNPCTSDTCFIEGHCSHSPNIGECSDGSLCTDQDICEGTRCVGRPVVCDDGNDCTVDSCNPASGCQRTGRSTPECLPSITLDTPPRGHIQVRDPFVWVTGRAMSPAGAIAQATINGVAVSIVEGGRFAFGLGAKTGLNVVEVRVVDELGTQTSMRRAFHYYPDPRPVSGPESLVSGGLQVTVGPKAFDDGNPADLDDLASLMAAGLTNLDLGASVSNPIERRTLLWCDYGIDLQSLTHGPPAVSLVPVEGGLDVTLRISSLTANLVARGSGLGCGDVRARASAGSVVISGRVNLRSTATTISGQPGSFAVQVSGIRVVITDGWGDYVNDLLGILQSVFAEEIEDIVERKVVDLLRDELMPLETGIKIPGAMVLQIPNADDGAFSIGLGLELKAAGMDAGGLVASFDARVGLQGALESGIAALGTFRANQDKTRVPDRLGSDSLLMVAIHDDLLNQALWSIWAGGPRIVLTEETLGGTMVPGVSNASLTIVPALPPLVFASTEAGLIVVQAGDVGVELRGRLGGGTLSVAGVVQVDLLVELTIDSSGHLAARVAQIRRLDIDLVSGTGPQLKVAGSDNAIDYLLKRTPLRDIALNWLTDSILALPLPVLDLGSLVGRGGQHMRPVVRSVTRIGSSTVFQLGFAAE